MIGIVIPGLPIITGGPITSNTVVSDVNNPGTINNITLFQTDMLPNDYGAALYFYHILGTFQCLLN